MNLTNSLPPRGSARLALVPRPRIRARTACWPLLRTIRLTRRKPRRVGENGDGRISYGMSSSWVGDYLGSIQKELVGCAARVVGEWTPKDRDKRGRRRAVWNGRVNYASRQRVYTLSLLL